MTKTLCPPLADKDVENLKAGDRVLISGIIYTARDAAHKKLLELMERGEKLPLDLKGQIIYYVGPTPAREGEVIGAAGPTTSSRMDKYTPPLLERGVRAVIGKGLRSQDVKKSLKDNKSVYLVAVGGAAALLKEKIVSSKLVAYEELGPEAIRELEVCDFPVFVANDVHGNDIYEIGKRKYERNR